MAPHALSAGQVGAFFDKATHGLTQIAAVRAFMLVLLLLSVGGIVGSLEVEALAQFDAFTFMLAKVTAGIGLWLLIDRYVLGEIDTINEIRKGNVAVALLHLGLLGLIGLAVGTA